MKKRTLLSWSSGKDSAWALQLLLQDPSIDLLGLFTVINQEYNRVCMHATTLEMLRRQAHAVGLPLQTISLPEPCSNEQYEAIMGRFVMESVTNGIECMAFGDLFLEEIRDYRTHQLKGTGIEPLFPLWGIPTQTMVEQMFSTGLEAYVSSVDLKRLPFHFAGKKWSRELIAEFPDDADPNGENGEIHTVVVGGTMFREPIPVRIGEIIKRDGFAYADIIPINEKD
jgi:uncharacterized protein (TIGR00290 family)